MTGSRRVFRWLMDHDGVTRRSEAELGDETSSGTSWAGWSDMVAGVASR